MGKAQWIMIGMVFTLVLTGCSALTISAAAQDTGAPLAPPPDMDSPQSTVEGFYEVYLQNSGYDPDQDIMHNPLVEGSYRDMPYLSADLVAKIDTYLASGEVVADPFLCAQDVPETITAGEPTFSADDEAVVPVTSSFEGHHFSVTVKQTGSEWQITQITCTP